MEGANSLLGRVPAAAVVLSAVAAASPLAASLTASLAALLSASTSGICPILNAKVLLLALSEPYGVDVRFGVRIHEGGREVGGVLATRWSCGCGSR